jgi:hypothetical protein
VLRKGLEEVGLKQNSPKDYLLNRLVEQEGILNSSTTKEILLLFAKFCGRMEHCNMELATS